MFANFVNSKDNAVAVCFEEEAELIGIPKIVYGSMGDDLTLAKNVFSVFQH